LAKSGKDLKAGKGLPPRAAYALALPAVSALYGAIYQYVKTGQGPTGWKDLFYPRTGGKDAQGQPERIQIPGYMKDVFSYGHDPIGTIKGKVSPLADMVSEMADNRTDFGRDLIADPRDPAWRQAEDYAKYVGGQFEPFSFRRPPSDPGSNLSLPERIIGIKQAPYWIRNPQGMREIEDRELNKARKSRDRHEAQK